jgi:lipopolysaccharide/colanic/teichoic acid biosynthesis glycosyltransferase
MGKRLLDLLLVIPGIIMLLPLFALVAISIKIDSKGPVFYRQERMGYKFRPFRIYKFRTMVEGADRKGPQITSGMDSRVTRVGTFLRTMKFDEFPQLLNVLRGEMSLVGPRPEVRKYVEAFRRDYEMILKVRPGITDISSIVYRNEEALLGKHENPEAYYVNEHLPKKIQLAKRYVGERSIIKDIKLILLTVRGVLKGEELDGNNIDVIFPAGGAR